MLTIDHITARRFILGRQGLWPGRRWRGIEGVVKAMRAVEYLQLDPLQMIARSHDIQLYSRVLDYSPGMWEKVTYGERPEQRLFFDWGGWLAARPMDEMPYWRVAMRRERDGEEGTDQRIHRMATEHAEAIAEMLEILRERGTVSNRDFQMSSRKRTHSYRGRKDSSLALYYLWRTGAVMTHHRENFERVYALTESVAPRPLIYEADDTEADRFMMTKEIRFSGLWRARRTAETFHRGAASSKTIPEELLENGAIVEVQVEGWKGLHYAPAEDAVILQELSSGRVPEVWRPLDGRTADETVFLAPLDPVSARGRAKTLFGFDYIWEVYKPEHLRKYGYYTLPVLWDDRLVARFDSKLDRSSGTFIILGMWLEDGGLADDEAFAEALGRGFARFVNFLNANRVNADAVREPLLRERIQQAVAG